MLPDRTASRSAAGSTRIHQVSCRRTDPEPSWAGLSSFTIADPPPLAVRSRRRVQPVRGQIFMPDAPLVQHFDAARVPVRLAHYHPAHAGVGDGERAGSTRPGGDV